MADDFNDMIDEFAANVKRVVGPFSGLFNQKSSHAAEAEIAELKARIANQDRTINTLTGAAAKFETDLNAARLKLAETELECDALRAQLGEHRAQLAPGKPKKRITDS